MHSITFKLQKESINERLHHILSEQIKSSTDNRCSMAFRIYDTESKRNIKMTSDVKIPLNKAFIELLDELNIDFEINE